MRQGDFIAAALLFLLCSMGPAAQADEMAEQQVKAAFLYNFAKFVEWPESAFAGPDAPLVFCVPNDDAFGAALDPLRIKTVKGRKIAVKSLSDLQDARACHVLFLGAAAAGRMEGLLSALAGAPVLLVGDSERFVRRGGMIGFILERNKVVFEINEGAAKRTGLVVSSQLLKLARTVY